MPPRKRTDPLRRDKAMTLAPPEQVEAADAVRRSRAGMAPRQPFAPTATPATAGAVSGRSAPMTIGGEYPMGDKRFAVPGLQSTRTDARQTAYLDQVRRQRMSGKNVINPIAESAPDINPFTDQPWRNIEEYKQFEASVNEAFAPIPDQDKIAAWSEGNILARAGTPEDKDYAKNVPEMFFGTAGEGRDAAVRRNLNTGLVSEKTRGEYTTMRTNLRKKLAELYTSRKENITPEQTESVMQELIRMAGPQMQEFTVSMLKRQLGKDPKGREALAAMQNKYEQATFDIGNPVFQALPEEGQTQIRERIAYYDAGILPPGEKTEDFQQSQMDMGVKAEDGLSMGDMLKKQAGALREVYGLGQAAPGKSAPTVTGTVQTERGTLRLLSDGTMLEEGEAMPGAPTGAQSFAATVQGTMQSGKGEKINLMSDGTERLDPQWLESLDEVGQAAAITKFLDSHKKFSDASLSPEYREKMSKVLGVSDDAERLKYIARDSLSEKHAGVSVLPEDADVSTETQSDPLYQEFLSERKFKGPPISDSFKPWKGTRITNDIAQWIANDVRKTGQNVKDAVEGVKWLSANAKRMIIEARDTSRTQEFEQWKKRKGSQK